MRKQARGIRHGPAHDQHGYSKATAPRGSAGTSVICHDDAGAGRFATRQRKRCRDGAVCKEPFAGPEGDGMDFEPERIDQVSREQRLDERGAAIDVQVVPGGLLDGSDGGGHITRQDHVGLPVRLCHRVRGDILGGTVDARPKRVIGPIGCPDVVGGTTDEQIERQCHLRADDRGLGFVGVWSDPATMRETAAGVFVGTAWTLDDAVERDEFDDDEFAHRTSGIMNYEL